MSWGIIAHLGTHLMTVGVPLVIGNPWLWPVRSEGQCAQSLGKPGLLPQALELLQLLGKAMESPGQVWEQHCALSLGEPPAWEMPESPRSQSSSNGWDVAAF